MNSIRIFDPTLNDRLETMFRRFTSPLQLERDFDLADIRVDVVEKDGAYKVRADLPGVKKEDIHVRVDGNLVQIDAQTQDAKEFKEDGGTVLRSERYYGSLSRAFTLGQDVDEGRVVARYNNGVLHLELPKKKLSPSETKLIKVE